MPDTYQSIKNLTLEAGIDLKDKEGYFVTIDGNGKLIIATTAQGTSMGVLTLGDEVDRAVSYAAPDGGHVPVMSGEALAVGTFVAVAADGRAITWGGGGGDSSWGVVLSAATAADQLVTIAHWKAH